MNLTVIFPLVSLSLFVLLIGAAYSGFVIAQGKAKKDKAAPDSSSVSTVTGAIFALMGLLIAFTFSGAFSRLDARRTIIVDEFNSVKTAHSRIDLLSEKAQLDMRSKFKEYVASRVRLVDSMTNKASALEEVAKSGVLQNELWELALVATNEDGFQHSRVLVINALNQMFDITNRRTIAAQTHPPLLIFIALGIVAVTCAGLVGYGANIQHRLSRVHVAGFAGIIAFVFYVILDVEYPSFGIVKLELANALMSDFYQTLK